MGNNAVKSAFFALRFLQSLEHVENHMLCGGSALPQPLQGQKGDCLS